MEEITTSLRKKSNGGKFNETTGYKKTFFDKHGKPVRSEVLTPAETDGEFILNVYERKNGQFIKNTVGTVKTIFNGNGKKIERNLVSPDGITTKQVKVQGEKLTASEYVISDKDGNKIYNSKRTHKKIDDNHYVTTVNGQKYTTELDGDNIIVSKLDKDGHSEKTVTLGPDKLSPEFKSLYAKIPADYLMDIHDMGIRIVKDITGGNNAAFGIMTAEEAKNELTKEERDAYCDKETGELPPTIILSEVFKNDVFVVLHELGHAKDYLMFNNLHDDEKLQLIFNTELKDYTQKSTKAEDHEIGYFIDLEHYSGNSLKETIAETHALLSGAFNPNNDGIGIRSIVLQKNFPKTIAYIGDALNNPKIFKRAEKE